jgi:amidohydrolase
VIQALQTVVSRRTDPLQTVVLSICTVSGGTAYNIIPDTATIGGTVRTFSPGLAGEVKKLMRQIIKGVTDTTGATFTLEYIPGYPVGTNDRGMCRLVRESVTALYGKKQVVGLESPSTGAEDFSYFMKKVPGMMFRLGVGGGAYHSIHNSKFNLNEKGLGYGVGVFVKSVLGYLN